jgi:flagellar hook-associated protein 1 FlgK
MTTLVPALTNALSGLVTSKSAIDVLSNNIANVNTEGYTRKLTRAESITLGGQGVGVKLAVLTRNIDSKLQKDILTENGILSKLDVSHSYYQQIQSLFGNTADNNSIAHLLSDFSQKLQTLADSPTAAAAQYETGQEAQSLTTRFNSMSEQLQYLRVEADREVEGAVNSVNEQLTLVKNLNDHIQRESALGKTTADLEDQRDVALKDLSNLIDIRINPQSDGTTMVFTTSGRPLVDVGGARLLDHTSANTLSADMTKAGGNIFGITSLGRDLTDQIQGGKLKALIDMRDKTLPNLQSELDGVAQKLMVDLNQINNRGVGYPTLQTNFNGSRSFVSSATQTISYGSGDTVVGLFNSDGSSSATTTIKTIMGGSGPYTIDAVATGLQNWLQTTGGLASATVAVDATTGKLNINLNTTSLGLSFRDQPMTEFTSVAKASQTAAIDAGGALGAGTLTLTDSAGSTVTVNPLDNTTTLQSLATAINGVGNFAATVIKDNAGYRLKVTDTAGQDVSLTFGGAGGANWQNALKLTPSAAQADATIRFDADNSSGAYTSKAYPTNWRSGGADALTINGTAITVNAGDSLSTIAASINGAAIAGVTASVTTDASGDHLYIDNATGAPLVYAADTFSMSGADQQVQGFANFFGLNDLFVDNRDNYVYDTPVRAANWTTNGPSTLNVLDRVTGTAGAVGSITIPAGSNLQAIAKAINGDPDVSALVTASVVPDGSGYRLRLTHNDNTEMALTGNAVAALGLNSAAVGTSRIIDIRSDIKLDPSLISRGAMIVNTDSSQMSYQLSEGDNSTVRAMVAKMSTQAQFDAAGEIGSGKYTYSDYGAAIISVNTAAADVNKQSLDYQQPLNESLETRQKNLSGVNLDEEMASLIVYQTAYQAAARVVSVTQKMMDILDSILQ